MAFQKAKLEVKGLKANYNYIVINSNFLELLS